MCGRLEVYMDRDDLDYLRARDLRRDASRPTPMQEMSVITERGIHRAVWGIPRKAGGAHTHARIEEGPTTWASAWYSRRGVVRVAGWWEGSWHVAVTDAYLPVLTSWQADGMRAVVVTQSAGIYADRIERFPIPLTADGAADWLGGEDPNGVVGQIDVTCEAVNDIRQDTIFDAFLPTRRRAVNPHVPFRDELESRSE